MQNLKTSDANNQALGLTFTSKIENEKLIIYASTTSDLNEYHAEISPNPYIDF